VVDGAQMAAALLGKQHQQLALEFVVAASLAGEMVVINGGMGHRTLETTDCVRPQMRPFCTTRSAMMVNEALTTFVNRELKWVSKGVGVHYPSNW
jgi:hypothetical protein